MNSMRPTHSLRARRLAAGIALLALTGVAAADERTDLEKLRATVTGLIGALVEQGVLSREAADGMIKKAEADAARTVAAQAARSPPARPRAVRGTHLPPLVEGAISGHLGGVRLSDPLPAGVRRVVRLRVGSV
jgi:hypothetical protein